MQRRDFCKFLAVTAASKAIPSFAQASPNSQSELPEGFNRYTQSYEDFCALPPEKRIFYKVSDGDIVQAKLDESAWQPPLWNYNPSPLQVAGGMWDDVPLESPISNLSGDGPFKPTWDSLLEYEAPDWYRDAKFGIWAHWSPQCVPEAGDWYARNLYVEGQRQYEYHLQHYGPASRFGYKDLCAQWTLLNWEPDELMARYKKAGARIFVALANHHVISTPGIRSITRGMQMPLDPIGMSSAHGRRLPENKVYDMGLLCTRPGTGGGFSLLTAPISRDRRPAFLTTAF